MEQPKSRTGVFFVVAIALAVVAMVLPWLDFGSSSSEPAPEAPPEAEPAPAERACTADDLARVAGLEVGATVTEDWAIRAISCDEQPACTRVEVARAEQSITLRVCAHSDDAPLAPATHGSSDVFFDSPHDPEHPVSETAVRAVLDATVARLAS